MTISNKTLNQINPGTKYANCTFELEFVEHVKGNSFLNCKFSSICMEMVENCRFMNCSFPELIIEEIEKTTIKGGYIQCLRLSNLMTSDREFNFLQTDNAKELHLDACEINKIPPSLSQMKNVMVLDLSQNEMTNITEITKLVNLKELHLNNNHIREIPTSITKLQKLTTLILDNNNIKDVPAELGQLQNLTQLSLLNNNIDKDKQSKTLEFFTNCDVKI
ncbi:leucine-rich repeat domain-containing protein [Candidatus Uabimicrobium sp. HlEnr_7]|uniref:leucine-rich repeat domain-containing protein n=1 Tax=Candidatus Uabimicrobium helgolandensis TaxID=3095367 RepID=UPI003558C339